MTKIPPYTTKYDRTKSNTKYLWKLGGAHSICVVVGATWFRHSEDGLSARHVRNYPYTVAPPHPPDKCACPVQAAMPAEQQPGEEVEDEGLELDIADGDLDLGSRARGVIWEVYKN